MKISIIEQFRYIAALHAMESDEWSLGTTKGTIERLQRLQMAQSAAIMQTLKWLADNYDAINAAVPVPFPKMDDLP